MEKTLEIHLEEQRERIAIAIETRCKVKGHENHGDGYSATYAGRYGGVETTQIKAPTPKVCDKCSDAAEVARGVHFV
jgi:hypothetical protein